MMKRFLLFVLLMVVLGVLWGCGEEPGLSEEFMTLDEYVELVEGEGGFVFLTGDRLEDEAYKEARDFLHPVLVESGVRADVFNVYMEDGKTSSGKDISPYDSTMMKYSTLNYYEGGELKGAFDSSGYSDMGQMRDGLRLFIEQNAE